MLTKFKTLILSATFFCAWEHGECVAMDSSAEKESIEQETHNIFDQQVLKIKQYIANLEVAPNLVFGVSSSEEGIERFDKSWIFVDLDFVNGPRDLTLDFNSLKNMQTLAKAFPNTFQTIAFDAEVPNYFKGFGRDHLRAIHATLKMGGAFYLPYQYPLNPDYNHMEKWSDKRPEEALVAFEKEINQGNRSDIIDPTIQLPWILGGAEGHEDEPNRTSAQREFSKRVHQKVIEKLRSKTLRAMKGIFGEGNVEILPTRKLPFPENGERLTLPRYLDVFLAKKAFPTEDIPELTVSETSLEEKGVEKEEGRKKLHVKPLAEQIQELKEELKNIPSPSLVVIVDENEQPERFDNSWVKITSPGVHYHLHDPLTLQTHLSLSEIKEIAKNFPNTFAKIVFDVETPSLEMKGWTKEHFHYLSQALKPGGTLTVPIQFSWYIDHDKTSTGFYLYFMPKDRPVDENHLPMLKETEDGQHSLFVRQKNGSVHEIKSNVGTILGVSNEYDNSEKDRENVENFISRMHGDKSLWDEESREVEKRVSQIPSGVTIPENDLKILWSKKPKKEFLRYNNQAMQNILKLETMEDIQKTESYMYKEWEEFLTNISYYKKWKDVLPTLEQSKQLLIQGIESDPNKFVFEGFSTPYIFQSEENKNIESMKILSAVSTYAHTDRVVDSYMKTKFSEKGIEEIRRWLKRYGSDEIEALLTNDLLEIINLNLYSFIHGPKEHMEDAIEQYLLEPERIKFIKKFTSRYLIPHTVEFFEDIFGNGHVGVAKDKKLPFDVVVERQFMDYVVFKCHKGL